MGAAQTQRGDRLIRRQIDDELNTLVNIRRGDLNRLHALINDVEAQRKNLKEQVEWQQKKLEKAEFALKRRRAEVNALKFALKEERGMTERIASEMLDHFEANDDGSAIWAIILFLNRFKEAQIL